MEAGAKPGPFLDLHRLVLAGFGHLSPADTSPSPSVVRPGLSPASGSAARTQHASSRPE